eukprot:g7570.t1
METTKASCISHSGATPFFTGSRTNKRTSVKTHAAPKKLNTLDKDWTKKFIGYGYFSEDQESSSVNIFERLERKKVLSSVEQAGLLTAAEKAGLSLTKIEELGLLSTAEKLGLLTLAEKALTSDPGVITSISIPFLIAMIGALVLIPGDNILESILRFGTAGAFGTGFLVFFAGGFLLSSLEEE